MHRYELARLLSFILPVSQGRIPRLQRYMYKMLEDLTNKLIETRKTGTNATQWSAIINAEGFGLFQHACPSCK